jgi:hypothetical protein
MFCPRHAGTISTRRRAGGGRKTPQLGFPKPIKIKNRLLYRRRDVEEFERRMAAESGEGRLMLAPDFRWLTKPNARSPC